MDFMTHMLLLRDKREETILGYDYSYHLRNWRRSRLLDIEDLIVQADMAAIAGINYDWWEDYNYWEMKKDTIPWKGNGD